MSEKWDNYYTLEQIKRIQEIEYESLLVFDSVCEKLGLTYILYGGSLLGAIKYNGFIPWDDDLDLAMPRPDYDRLIAEAQNYLPDKYLIQHPLTDRVTPYPYVKFRRTDTAMVEYRNHKLKMNHGVYFDIYPIDVLPEDNLVLEEQHSRHQHYVRMFVLRQSKYFDYPVKGLRDFLRSAKRRIQHYCLCFYPRKKLYSKIDTIERRYNGTSSKRMGNLNYPKPCNYFDPFYPLIEVDFEGLKVEIPSGYGINLKNRYGDITKLPPEDCRIGHMSYALSLNKTEE